LNRFLTGTCVFVLAFFAFGSANAQEFNGFYIGGNAGVVSGRVSPLTVPIFSPTGYFASTSTPAIATASDGQHFDPDRLTAGGQVGFTHQWDTFVFGLEADFGTLTASKTSSTTVVYPCCLPTSFHHHASHGNQQTVYAASACWRCLWESLRLRHRRRRH